MIYLAFERRILRLIFRTNTPLSPVHVAYYLGLPVAEARGHLETMVTTGILELESDDAGRLLYVYPERPPLESLPPPRPPRRRRQSMALVPATEPAPLASHSGLEPQGDGRRYSAAAAAALSLFLPGVGQIYSGRIPQGVGWMFATGLGYLLFVIPGLILHACCVINAAAVPMRLPALVDRI